MLKTAVIILNWNGKKFLEKFLPNVLENSRLPATEVIVADNGSTDGSLEWLMAYPKNITCIKLAENLGYAGGYREALKQIEADYYVLLNSDVEVSENWLQPLLAYMDSHPKTAACQPKIRAFYQRDEFEYAGAAGGYIDFLGYPFCRGRIFDRLEKDVGQYDTARSVFWATGACLMVRKTAYEEAGGLDAGFFAHMEEIDLCWRMRNLGYDIACIPQSTVYHVGGGTLEYQNPAKVYLNFRNNLYLLYKNLPLKKRKWRIFLRMMLDGIAALKYLFEGKPKLVKAILRAHRDFRKAKPQLNLHRNIQTGISYPADPTISRISLLLQYYLRNRKTFDRIKF